MKAVTVGHCAHSRVCHIQSLCTYSVRVECGFRFSDASFRFRGYTVQAQSSMNRFKEDDLGWQLSVGDRAVF